LKDNFPIKAQATEASTALSIQQPREIIVRNVVGDEAISPIHCGMENSREFDESAIGSESLNQKRPFVRDLSVFNDKTKRYQGLS
jgi:hypothetical protein